MDVLLSERTKNHWENVDANEFGRFGCFGAFASRPRFPEVFARFLDELDSCNLLKNLVIIIYCKTFTAKEC